MSGETWRIRSLFISSTFRDMHAERDWLQNHVFPQLEERLRHRRYHLETTDLRIGALAAGETEASREAMVLKLCLAEIDRCRPFSLVLLGDRYGWVPSPYRIQAVASGVGLSIADGFLSVTALEIQYILRKLSPAERVRCFFYVREALPYAAMDPVAAARYSDAHGVDESASENAKSLRALKESLLVDPDVRARVRSYAATWDSSRQRVIGLESWGEQVLEDLWGEFERETAAFEQQRDRTWQETEAVALGEFIEQGNRDFVGRHDVLGQLEKLVVSQAKGAATWGVCIRESHGAGKSALFSRLVRHLAEDESILVLANAAGTGPHSSDLDRVLFRWIGELASRLGTAVPVTEDTPSEVVDIVFASLLSRAAGSQRIVIVLDALDQMEGTVRAQELHWLPPVWPPNARLVLTLGPDRSGQERTLPRGIEALDLPPFAENEARDLAARIWARYHRVCPARALDLILAKRSATEFALGNPLWLTMAMEQLNLLDADDFELAEQSARGSPEERLVLLICSLAERFPPDPTGLYAFWIARLERQIEPSWVRAFVFLTTLSRSGWRERDLRILLPRVAKTIDPHVPFDLDPVFLLARIRRAFRGQLAQRGPEQLLDFAHAQLRRALDRNELLRDGDAVSAIVRNAFAYLGTLPDTDIVRENEFIYYALMCDAFQEGARYLATAGSVRGMRLALQTLSQRLELAFRHPMVKDGKRAPNQFFDSVMSLLDFGELDQQERRNLFSFFAMTLRDHLLRRGQARMAVWTTSEVMARLLADDVPLETQRDLNPILAEAAISTARVLWNEMLEFEAAHSFLAQATQAIAVLERDAMWRAPRSSPTLRMTVLPSAPNTVALTTRGC